MSSMYGKIQCGLETLQTSPIKLHFLIIEQTSVIFMLYKQNVYCSHCFVCLWQDRTRGFKVRTADEQQRL